MSAPPLTVWTGSGFRETLTLKITETSPDLVTEVAEDLGPGPIIVARHGRPALDRRAGPKIGWREYKDWWARYEIGSLAPGQEPPEELCRLALDSVRVLSSTRARAIETATKVAPWAEIETDPVYVEANLPPPVIEGVRFLPKTWNILARAAWLRGHALDGEGVDAAGKRATLAAQQLDEAAEAGKIFLAAHGWFNRMLRPRLRKLGWRCVYDGGDKYWSYRVYRKVGF